MFHPEAFPGIAVLFASFALYAQVPSTCDSELCLLIHSGHLADLRWPTFSDYVREAGEYYEQGGYRLSWFASGAPSPEAAAIIGILRDAANKGLDPEDYDASRWSARVEAASASETGRIHSDLALTICLMRYIEDLHFGKFNPGLFHNRLDAAHEQFNLASTVRQLAQGTENTAMLHDLEPPFRGYQETQEALKTYITLASEATREAAPPLPPTKRPVEPGDLYPPAEQLARLLRRVGDLPENALTSSERYEGALVDALKKFQFRHGLESDGRIGIATLRELNTPLEQRVKQLQLALERWRWVPHSFERPPVVVNIPEFELRAFDGLYHTELEMKVVVGQAYRHHQTPVFAADMTYLTFRPYWHVPYSITRNELLPELERNHAYLAQHGYEVVNARDQAVAREIDDTLLAELRSGQLELRQMPGESNALGLVAFMFPNEHQVYMHDTPAATLFSKSRRDFSHGCIRLEHPLELAKWVLRDKPEWTENRILDAMHGTKTLNVQIEKPIPVLIVYATAIVTAGQLRFFEDIYGQDAQLNAEAATGYPTPGKKPEGGQPTTGGKVPRLHE